MTRIEVFMNEDPTDTGREYVALLQALERTPKGKVVITSCMYFFGSSPEEARSKVDGFVALELRKATDAEKRIADLSKRMRKAS